MQDAQRIHGEFIHGNFAGILRKAAHRGNGEHRLCIVTICYGEVDQALADDGIRQLPDGAQANRAAYPRVLGEEIGLMLGQAGVQDMACGAIGVFIIEKKSVLDGSCSEGTRRHTAPSPARWPESGTAPLPCGSGDPEG